MFPPLVSPDEALSACDDGSSDDSPPSSGATGTRPSPKAGFNIFCSFSSCTRQSACANGSRKSGVRQKFWNEGLNA